MGSTSSQQEKAGKQHDTEISVLKANIELNDQEMQEFYDEFKRKCPSGEMNKDQFKTFYKIIIGSKDHDGDLVDNWFTVFDKDHDGSIQFSEFVLALSLKNRRDLDGTLELAFKMADLSGDGYISFDEMVNILGKMLKMADSEEVEGLQPKYLALGIFDTFHLNKKQSISKQQFVDGCKKNETITELFRFS